MADRDPTARLRRRLILPAVLLAALAAALALLPLWPRGPARPDLPALSPFGTSDRVLVLAPHEDDETLGAGGAIQRTLAVGGAVRAVFLTSGDLSGWASALRRDAAAPTPESRLALGRQRREEGLRAAARLGLASDRVVFLGYPDGGALEIWRCHWGPARPLKGFATGAEAVPYSEAASAGRPHKGEAILEDVTRQLLDFRPTRVLVSHPQDRHGDHQAAALFLLAARLDAAAGGRLPPPAVLAFPVHAAEWPRPRGDRPGWWLPVPPEMAANPAPWQSLELSADEVRVKGEALRLHESQMRTIGREILSLVRRNELFAEVSAAPLPSSAAAGRLQCRDAGDALELDADLPSLAPRGGGVTFCAFGHRRDRPFGGMPKLRAVWTPGAGVSLFDQETALPYQPRAVSAGGHVTLLLPWAALGDPENVFVEARGEGSGEDALRAGWLLLSRRR